MQDIVFESNGTLFNWGRVGTEFSCFLYVYPGGLVTCINPITAHDDVVHAIGCHVKLDPIPVDQENA